MSLAVEIGVAQAIDGYTAAQQAARQALDKMGSARISLALVFASQEFDIQNVLAGISGLLGNTPQWGFSTTVPLILDGQRPHSVVVALLSGEDLKVQMQWIPSFAQDCAGAAQKLAQALTAANSDAWQHSALLLVVDGILGDAVRFCSAFQAASTDPIPPLVGCLAGGDFHLGKTYQIGGSQTGSGSLSAAFLSGKISLGVGAAHGWLPAGPYFHVTRSNGVWIRSLDGKTAAETYSSYFGAPAREWAFPPLTDLARLYPLGIENKDRSQRTIRSPLHVEADGSFRMQTSIPEGSVGHLLVGSLDHCLEAAREATRQALANLGSSSRPFFGLIFADVAWQMLFAAQPGAEITAIRETLGMEIPLAGGYTLGQIIGLPPQMLNQHLVVALLGEMED